MKRIISLGLLCLTAPLWAAKVVATKPEHGDTTLVKFAHYGQVYYHWVINDLVCLSRVHKNSIVCGRVAQYDDSYTVVRMAKANASFANNEEVKILYSKSRKVASTSTASVETFSGPRVLTTLGLGTGFSYLVFEGQFQYGLSRKVSLGITVPFANTSDGTNVTTAMGAILNGAYYLNERFTGYCFDGGLGLYSLTRSRSGASNSTTDTPLVLYGTFGWKGKINRGRFNLGVAGGLQYIAGNSTYNAIFTDFNGLLPIIKLTAGVEF